MATNITASVFTLNYYKEPERDFGAKDGEAVLVLVTASTTKITLSC